MTHIPLSFCPFKRYSCGDILPVRWKSIWIDSRRVYAGLFPFQAIYFIINLQLKLSWLWFLHRQLIEKLSVGFLQTLHLSIAIVDRFLDHLIRLALKFLYTISVTYIFYSYFFMRPDLSLLFSLIIVCLSWAYVSFILYTSLYQKVRSLLSCVYN